MSALKYELNKKDKEVYEQIQTELGLLVEQYEGYFRDSIEGLSYLVDPSETGPGEYIREFRRLDIDSFTVAGEIIDDIDDILVWLKKMKYDEDDTAQLLFKHCSIEYSTNYYSLDGQLQSCSIGEYEEQIDFEYHEELLALIEQLSPEARLELGLDDGHTTVYTEPCKFIAAVLDNDSFLTDFKQRLKSFILSNRGPATVYSFSSRRAKQRAPEYNIALKRRELFRPDFNNVILIDFSKGW